MIIIISAYDWSSIEEEAKAAGVSCFISKPLFQSTIYDTFMQLDIAHHEEKKVFSTNHYNFKGRHILLVEDNDLNLEIARTLLEFAGIIVDTAVNGELALDRFSQSPSGYYYAILMDIRMPVMDGLTATRKIRSLARKDAHTVPIIAMTANAFEEDKNMAIEAGMHSYLIKPINIEILFQELDNLNIEG